MAQTFSLLYDAYGLSVEAIGAQTGLSQADLDASCVHLNDAKHAVLQAHKDGTLGFMDLVDQDVSLMTSFASEACTRFTDQLVLGIGGSSLGARAILESASQESLQGLRTHFSENIDPASFCALLQKLNWSKTLIVVITKSGSTVETMGKFWIAYAQLVAALGERVANSHVLAITDPERGGLRKLVRERGFASFDVPPHVGGRFSVLTAVGLVPLALAGYDIAGLLKGAAAARDAFVQHEVEENLVLQVSAHQHLLVQQGISQFVMMAYSDALNGMVDWFRQLWAESLGKAHDRQGKKVHTGITPIKAIGAIDQHSQVQLYVEGPRDKHIAFLRVLDHGADMTIPTTQGLPTSLQHLHGKGLAQILDAELRGTRLALQDAGQPTSVWTFDAVTPSSVGAFVMVWECATAVTGELWNIDAFDQPGVELGKIIAHGLLGRAKDLEVADSMISKEPRYEHEHEHVHRHMIGD